MEPLAPQRPFNEAALPSGELTPEWCSLNRVLDNLGAEELKKRWRQAQRLLQENGVTYNVYADPRGIDRPWQLDPVPLLLSPEEWQKIEAAIAQRATLLSRILADIYGPQRLLSSASLPADFVFTNPGFLRPCHGIEVPRGNALVVYGADLARSPDGQWWVLTDRTQAPSGAGYALENRVVVSRILPELFQDFPVRRLAAYHQTFRESLMSLAPQHRDNPRVVLLTPGPFNETYFEHAYLARYLGFPLVEGADLTVRDEKLYLKTLGGLLPIDVVLRRQDDHFCDPLELYGDSALGVPGLTQAVRARNVAVANALGSGFLESTPLMSFLPALCRGVLGEELRMPSVRTRWCRNQNDVARVFDRLDEWVIKPAFPGPQRKVFFGARLSRAEQASLRQRMESQPFFFVAQEQMALSTVPTGFGPAAEPRPMVLRVFAVATADGYEVMPGGLTRVSATHDSLVVSSQAGGGSKDTWVLTHEQEPYLSLLGRVSRPIDVSRDGSALTSRVADNLFWLGRMSERLETGVRLFRTALRHLVLSPEGTSNASLRELVELLEQLGLLGPAPHQDRSVERRLLESLFDSAAPRSLRDEAQQLHRLAWQLRDRISPDAWRILSRLERQLVEPPRASRARASTALELLDDVLITLSSFSGLVMESTTRGLGWRFLDIGRRIERGLHVIGLFRSSLKGALSTDSWRPQHLLEITDCAMTYRSRYVTSVQFTLVADLLLLDESNPRSLAFQLARIDEHLKTLGEAPAGRLRQALEGLRSATADQLVATSGETATLATLLEAVTATLLDLSNALNHAYMSHTLAKRQPSAVGSSAS